jgi:hypothetical protein
LADRLSRCHPREICRDELTWNDGTFEEVRLRMKLMGLLMLRTD